MSTNSDRFKINLAHRVNWLIRLRWGFAAAIFIIAWMVSNVFGIIANPLSLYLLALAVFAYNSLLAIWVSKFAQDQSDQANTPAMYRMTIAQIVIDLLALSVLIILSGGLQNPFRSFFVFHMIIGSIVLSRRAAHLQAVFATFLLIVIALIDYNGVIPHQQLLNFGSSDVVRSPVYVFGTLVATISSLFLAVYLTTSIVKELRQKGDELLETKNALENANRSLEEIHKLRSENLLTVTHELKSPLSTIEGFLQLLKNREEMGISESKKDDIIDKALNRTHALLLLISDLLDLAKVRELGPSQPMRPLNACLFLQETVDFYSTEAIKKQLKFLCHPPCAIKLDISEGQAFPKERCSTCRESEIESNKFNLEHLFSNLIGNAIKYTIVGGLVQAELVRTESGLNLIVADTGIGIPAEEIPKLFKEFYRCSNAKGHDSAGTGLGLAIVKQIVDSQNGSIKVAREPVAGTRFTVFLPFHN